VQYRYDDNCQFAEVINRNDDSVRRFSCIDDVMASFFHSKNDRVLHMF
jgi:hypothetical protein